MRLKRFEFELFQKFFPSDNPRQNLLSQMKIFSIFRQRSQHLLIQLKYSVNPPSPQVNVVCLDSGDVLHDFFRVTEINNIDLGGKGGHLLFRSTFFRFVTRVLARIVAVVLFVYSVELSLVLHEDLTNLPKNDSFLSQFSGN